MTLAAASQLGPCEIVSRGFEAGDLPDGSTAQILATNDFAASHGAKTFPGGLP